MKLSVGCHLHQPFINNRVYIASRNTYCLNAATGELIWKNEICTRPLSVVKNKVYTGSDDGNIYCLNGTTGEVIWSYDLGSYMTVSPTVVNNRVYVCSDDGYMYCFG